MLTRLQNIMWLRAAATIHVATVARRLGLSPATDHRTKSAHIPKSTSHPSSALPLLASSFLSDRTSVLQALLLWPTTLLPGSSTASSLVTTTIKSWLLRHSADLAVPMFRSPVRTLRSISHLEVIVGPFY
jgi:hypothetical protein